MIQKEEAVSPVIGVILMVAITVILAAVIAAFVFGMAGTTSTSKNVGLTVGKSSDNYGVITINGGADVPSLNLLEYSIDGGATWPDVSGSDATTAAITQFSIGRIVYAREDVTGKKLQIKGSFDDGTQQVLIERQF